jgi:hypothetical protein
MRLHASREPAALAAGVLHRCPAATAPAAPLARRATLADLRARALKALLGEPVCGALGLAFSPSVRVRYLA